MKARERIFLIGGSSSTGKTTVAGRLADRLGWEAVGAALPAEPELDPLTGIEIWDRPPQELCALLVAAAEASIPHLLRQVRGRAGMPGTILEGERVHPELVAQLEREGAARGAFIVETDAQRLYDTLMARSRGFRKIEERRRRAVAEVDRLYGQWVVGEASRVGVPWVPSQPWDTLADRLLENAFRGFNEGGEGPPGSA
jgi:2-phosphoglycerate kinase